MQSEQIKNLPIKALTARFSAMFDRAARAISQGEDPKDHPQVPDSMLGTLTGD